MHSEHAPGLEPDLGKFWSSSRKRERNVVLYVARREQKARHYNHSIVAACNRVESIGKRRRGELYICVPDIELSPMCPNVLDKLFELQVRGLLAASVADNQDARALHPLRSGVSARRCVPRRNPDAVKKD